MDEKEKPVTTQGLQPNPPEVITWRIAGAFFWGIGWRLGLVAGILAAPRGFVMGYTHKPFPYEIQWWVGSQIIQIFVGWWIMKRILNSGISGYQLAVTRKG